MDLEIENYEADLVDFQLQDSPFYESPNPAFIFDTAMQSFNRLTGGSAPSPVSAGKLSGKAAGQMNGNDYGGTRGTNNNNNNNNNENINNNRNEFGNGSNNYNDDNVAQDLSPFRFSKTFDDPPKKKNRKCVSFLPNLVEVSDSQQMQSFLFKIH